jgi:hypothetical protein
MQATISLLMLLTDAGCTKNNPNPGTLLAWSLYRLVNYITLRLRCNIADLKLAHTLAFTACHGRTYCGVCAANLCQHEAQQEVEE